jgi:hypothetical protein
MIVPMPTAPGAVTIIVNGGSVQVGGDVVNRTFISDPCGIAVTIIGGTVTINAIVGGNVHRLHSMQLPAGPPPGTPGAPLPQSKPAPSRLRSARSEPYG